MYEIARDEFHRVRDIVYDAFGQLGDPLPKPFASLVIEYLMPYIYQVHPYAADWRYWSQVSRAIVSSSSDPKAWFFQMPKRAIDRVTSFLGPVVLLSVPIPCAITTISHVRNFNYNQFELITAIKRRGEREESLVSPYIRAVGNQEGYFVAAGASDPRDRPAKVKHGKTSAPGANILFGTAQTTFWVKTPHREDSKIFAVKMFQNNVSLETLGGLWADCRDTRDVNETVLNEVRLALNRPELVISEFSASMRNYRFKVLGGYHILLPEALRIFREIRATTHPNIYCSIDTDRCTSAIIEIEVANHTSKNKKLTVKMFQSGKINLDSNVFYEHIYDWFRFINDFFIKYGHIVLYIPAEAGDEYDSDYYYNAEGVQPPPRNLVERSPA